MIGAGNSLSLNSLKGKYVYLDFWSTSCGPCIAEFPALKKIHEEYTGDHFVMVGIVDDRSKGKLEQLMLKHNVVWPNIDLNAAATRKEGYHIVSYPTTYLIDPQGKVIASNIRSEELKTRLQFLKVKNKL